MSIYLNIKITTGSSLGPYIIYYDEINPSNIALLYPDETPATNVSYADLTSVNGVTIIVPDNMVNIILYNISCDNSKTQIPLTPTPTPTISVTPTITPTPTITLTPSITPTITPTISITPSITPSQTSINCDIVIDFNEVTDFECELIIPEAFSPNGDGTHDYFDIYCIESLPNAVLRIFDDPSGDLIYGPHIHYGNISYWGTYESSLWNGRDNNGILPTQNTTYVYVLEHGDDNTSSGTVHLAF